MPIIHYPDQPLSPTDKTRWVKWFHHPVQMPNGKQYEWGYIHCRDAVAFVVFDNDKNFPLVAQYRYPLQIHLTEIPKGFVEDRETPLSAAQRELEEEVKMIASTWQPLGELVTAPGIGRIKHHLFLAHGLSPCENAVASNLPHEPEEDLVIEWVSFHKFFDRVAKGEITDAVTIAAVMKARLVMGE